MGLHLKKILKSNKSRYCLFIKEFRLRKFKSVISNLKIKPKIRMLLSKRLIYFSKKGVISNIKNRCLFTGRSRGIYKICKLSRITFKNEVSTGNLTGFKKSSW